MSGAAGGVWLGVPGARLEGTPADAFVSRLGGVPSWLRVPAPPKPQCDKCKVALSLLAQLHVPLSVFDRILYVFVCLACASDTPTVSVLRSQVYNEDYDEELHVKRAAAAAVAAPKVFQVEESDDWGDDEPAKQPTVAAPVAAVPIAPRFTFAPGVAEAMSMPKKCPLPCFTLDTVPEPRAEKASRSDDDVLRTLEERDPDVVDKEAGGDDVDGDDDDDVMDDFMERMARAPYQCVRWEPKGYPIRAFKDAPLGPVPACEACGAPRDFECQVVSPAIYVLCGHLKEAEQPLHFSTILVYTCSKHCYGESTHYSPEVAIVHREI